MLVKDGLIQKMFIEPEEPGDPFKVSDADTMLKHINPMRSSRHEFLFSANRAARIALAPARC